MSRFAGDSRERLEVVEAAPTIIRDDAENWECVQEIRRSKEKYYELRCDLDQSIERLPEYSTKLPPTFSAFSEACFGWDTGLKKPLPGLAPNEEMVTSMVDDIKGSVD